MSFLTASMASSTWSRSNMADFFVMKPTYRWFPEHPSLDDLQKGYNITSAITDANFTFSNTKEHTMGNTYESVVPGSTNTLRITDAGVAIYGNVLAIDFKKEDLPAIAADILAIGGITEVDSFYLTSEQRANRYSEGELTNFAYNNLKAIQIKLDRKAAEAKREEASEAKRKEEAERAKEDEYLNSPDAMHGLYQFTEEGFNPDNNLTWRAAYGDGTRFSYGIVKVVHNWFERYESGKKYKHELLREEVAQEFYFKAVFNLKPNALKAVDEIVALRQKASEALEIPRRAEAA